MTNRRLLRAMRRRGGLCVGLMSGTRVDGIDAAPCRTPGSGASAKLALIRHLHLPFEPDLSARVRRADSAREISELNFVLGERFARAALRVISLARLRPGGLDAIG